MQRRIWIGKTLHKLRNNCWVGGPTSYFVHVVTLNRQVSVWNWPALPSAHGDTTTSEGIAIHHEETGHNDDRRFHSGDFTKHLKAEYCVCVCVCVRARAFKTFLALFNIYIFHLRRWQLVSSGVTLKADRRSVEGIPASLDHTAETVGNEAADKQQPSRGRWMSTLQYMTDSGHNLLSLHSAAYSYSSFQSLKLYNILFAK